MLTVNENFLKLPGNYLFSEISKRISAYKAEHPEKSIIPLSIGDATRPLSPAVVAAMHKAVDEMGTTEGFRGYGPEQGYAFLRETIRDKVYSPLGVDISADEIFISDGAKSDCGNIGDIFGSNNVVAVCDPVYPVYVDTNAMAGRAGEYDGTRWTDIVYMPCNEKNGFMPELPVRTPDIIYLCFPNNPTGAAATKSQLKLWVDYAVKNGALILFDAAYEAYISEEGIPHSIYEIDGAKECAIEFRSFSKTAGFTGTRCAYTIVPEDLKFGGASLNKLWNRRQCTKFNGVPYVVQRAAEAVYSEQGMKEAREIIDYYMNNARVIRNGLKNAGLTVYGGINSPYVWVKTPGGVDSWSFFDKLLKEAGVAVTPGVGFGPEGEGFIRRTGFGDAEQPKQAVERVTRII
ncbi:MAG: LL-diaminopimelate aminotransferase [Clostridiales bacterium]|nr:LL-diaminopimelate aminotransferase [Clostridiales bacterium]